MRTESVPTKQREAFVQKFNACRPVLSAVGDENRQLIIRVLIENCGRGGLRVGEIQSNTNISRTAVSHHLKVLREAGIISVRHEGTKNFYYLDFTMSSLQSVSEFWREAVEMMRYCPAQREKEK